MVFLTALVPALVEQPVLDGGGGALPEAATRGEVLGLRREALDEHAARWPRRVVGRHRRGGREQ